jgi:beta-phosphoglucomutase
MDALIFDFDGVVVDSEPIHFAGFRRVLRTAGIELTEEDYYSLYLGYDDHDCFEAVGRNTGVELTDRRIAELTAAKTQWVKQALAETIQPLPGAVELIRAAAAAGVPLAICSGALREEIELASRTVGIDTCIATIVAAEDVARGKPDPEGYLLACRQLGRTPPEDGSPPACRPERCVVVEDSPAGIEAGKGAGMAVLAVTNSYPADQLAAADRIVASLADVSLAALEELL